jgi:glutamate--cysteine ligase
MNNTQKAKITAPVQELNDFIAHNEQKINDWLQHKKLQNTPIYSSIDIRNSGFKIAPIDTNLFPSGFNNLDEKSAQLATKYFSAFFKNHLPNAAKIAIIVENFTRNTHYREHLKVLSNVLQEVGLEVKLASFHPEAVNLFEGIEIFQAKRHENILLIGDSWFPDLILLNNDLTEEVPVELMNLVTPVLPALKYGWHSRKKSCHYDAYNHLIGQFCQEFDLDPWLLSTYFKKCKDISFRRKEGLECVARSVDELIIQIQHKYNHYHIKEEPVVFIKPNNGTFGRGIISVRNGGEVLNINKKLRHTLDVIKGNVVNSEVVIQEGINTIETFEGYSAENIVYLVDGEVVGKFIRYNTDKGTNHNLNSKGMFFSKNPTPLTSSEILISRIATIAVAYENIEYAG